MDIGAEISKKIQMAITAKLKELDAYVDDELPDYIMIMVANKKTESQMTEALSLFLSDNTKIFTSWLHNLLATLRKSKSDKKILDSESEGNGVGVKAPQSSSVEIEDSKENVVQGRNIKQESTKELVEIEKKESGPAEPEITIYPESDNIFEVEDELQTTEIVVEKNISDDSLLKSPPLPTSNVKDSKYISEKSVVTSAAGKKTSTSESKETVIRHYRESEKTSSKSITSSRKRKSDELSRSSQRKSSPISRRHKEERFGERREKRSSNAKIRALESDSKRYSTLSHDSFARRNSEKSRVRDWDRGKGENSDGEITSKWDRHKPEDQDNIWIESDEDEKELSARLRGSVSSAVNAVFQDEDFISDSESDNDQPKSSTIINSKVAYPERKMRVPLSKQANKALLMKAVTEAERSVRRKHTLLNEDVEEPEIYTKSKRNEKYKQTKSSNDVWVEKPRKKNLLIKRVLDKPMYQDREENDRISRSKKVILVRKNVAEARRRQMSHGNEVMEITRRKKTVRTKPPKVILFEDEEEQPVTVIHVRRKSQDKKAEKVIFVEGSSSDENNDDNDNNSLPATTGNTQIFMRDKRKFVARDLSPVNTTSAHEKSPAVKFDSRQAQRYSDNSEVEMKNNTNVKRKQKATAKVSPRPQKSTNPPTTVTKPDNKITSPTDTVSIPAISQNDKTQGPRFIVTLDGVVGPKQAKVNKVEATKPTAKGFKYEPVTAPVEEITSPSPSSIIPLKKSISTPIQKPIVIEAVDTEDDHEDNLSHSSNTEIGKMRRKLLKVQEEAAKLKQMQARLAAAQSQQNTLLKSSNKMYSDKMEAEQKSIYIGNVNFSTSEKQLSDYFSICGKISRVTILKDTFTGHPKGFAYLEFDDKRAVSSALALDNTQFNNRVIRVTLKQSKPVVTYPTPRAHIPSRSLYPIRPGRRLYRGSRFQHTSTRFNYPSTPSATKLPSRNKTWVNPSIASSSK